MNCKLLFSTKSKVHAEPLILQATVKLFVVAEVINTFDILNLDEPYIEPIPVTVTLILLFGLNAG